MNRTPPAPQRVEAEPHRTKSRFSLCSQGERQLTYVLDMSTILFPSPIFGPVHSRRLGISLGVNLLPADGKYCTFDCIYCECGFNGDHRTRSPYPTRAAVAQELETTLERMQRDGRGPDVITFAGNGEPTMHPDFAGIIEDTIALRDTYFPEAKISVLSNATFSRRPAVFAALRRVDNNILKLDTVSPDYIAHVDRPQVRYDVDELVKGLCAFEGKVQIQSLFMTGSYDGRSVDNTGDEYVEPWLEKLRLIAPEEVYVYTIDRDTPAKGLRKAAPEVLDGIAERVRVLGLKCQVSY